MLGIDLVQIDRIARIYEKFGSVFLDKFLNKKEQKLIHSVNNIAGFFAVKEAFSKSIGVGIGKEFSFFDIEIRKNKKNAPKIKIKKKIKKKFNIKKAKVSISHDGNIAAAIILIKK